MRLDSWIDRTPGETKHLEGLDSWRDWTPGVNRILERLDSLRDRTPGEAGQVERLHGLLEIQDSLKDRTLERKVQERQNTWRNWTPGVTRTLERLDP